VRRFEPGVPLLHVYGPYIYHNPAVLRGNREALIALRDAISRALETPDDGEANVFAADGEGYTVLVQRVTTMKALGTPEYIYIKAGARLRPSKHTKGTLA
jgi:hypothetical protein